MNNNIEENFTKLQRLQCNPMIRDATLLVYIRYFHWNNEAAIAVGKKIITTYWRGDAENIDFFIQIC